jgi:hypothetical protein
MHLSTSVATSTVRTGVGNISPFTILCTVPFSFSKTKISSGPRNAIEVGNSSVSEETNSTPKLGSLIDGCSSSSSSPIEALTPSISS